MKKLFTITLLITFILSAAFVYGQRMYVTVEGMKQGTFKGESSVDKLKNKIELTGYEMEIISPRDAATGMASGRRVRQPITIHKLYGAASIQFYQAISTNEQLKSVTIEFYKTNPDGTEKLDYSIKLTNASISSFKQSSGTASVLPAGSPRGLIDEIKFSYQSIELSNPSAGITATDNWNN